jgi:2,3-dihydroxybenzoate-AMP ligase
MYNYRQAARVCDFDADTVYLVTLPVAHNFPFGCPGALGTFEAGGQVILSTDPSPASAFAAIAQHRVTATALVPTLVIRWLDAPERTAYDLSSLRTLQVGGARLNPEIAQRVEPTLGCRLQQVFGMAEGLLNYTRDDDPAEEVIVSQGRPMSPADEIRIVDEDDREVGEGEPGELLTRGPYTIRGYYRADEHNATAFTADGFYRTGDTVRRLPSGNLIVEGRTKDLINRGGEKISAEEIENLILGHAAVRNVAAVAMPDPTFGERTCAFIVLREGAMLRLEELVGYLRGTGVAGYKLPERIECVAALPLTSVGKVNKRALREEIGAKLEAEGIDPRPIQEGGSA